MRMARTTNVYGRLRANRTIHMDVSLLGYGAQRKIRRSRACLQFLPTVSRNLNDDSYRPRFRSRSCSMHCETDRSHLSYALRFMAVPLISSPADQVCCQATSLFKLDSGHCALPRSAHRGSTPARRPIVFLECQAGIDEAKNSAGINHAMYEIFAPSNPLRMPLKPILQRQSLFLCHSLLPRHRLPPFR